MSLIFGVCLWVTSIYFLQPVRKRVTSSDHNLLLRTGSLRMQASRVDHAKNKPRACRLVGTLESQGQNNSPAVTQQTAGSPGPGTQSSLFRPLRHHRPSAPTSWPVSARVHLLLLPHFASCSGPRSQSKTPEWLLENPAVPR